MSSCWSVCPQQVLWKCYAVVNVWLLLLLLWFITFEHSVVIFCIGHCDSSSTSYMPVRNASYKSYDTVMSLSA